MDPETLIGQEIDQFLIEQHIARGNVADVYQAVDVGLKRKVALKVMRANLSYDEALTDRFKQEARAIAKIDHHNIIQIYMAGVTPDDRPYLAMQYVDGGTLGEKLGQLAAHSHEMPAAVALDIARQVAEALDVAHSAGVVHGNLKPSNILLRDDARVVVSDLRVPTVQEATTRMLMRDQVIRDTTYMSPEQRRGRKIDGRSDIYAVGLILYEMLAGKQSQPSLKKLKQLRPELPETAYHLVASCLEENPDDRFQTTGELIAALDQAIRDEGMGEVKPAPLPGRRGPVSRGKVLIVVLSAVILAAVAMVALKGLPFASSSETETPPPVSSPSKTQGSTASSVSLLPATATPTETPLPPTQSPTATPFPPSATPTEPPPTATITPATPTMTPTPTANSLVDCLNPVFFLSIWQASPQLGCPTLAFTSDVTYQFFEGGLLVWQKNPTPSTIHAVFNDGTWQQQTDPGGPAAPSCPEAEQQGDNAPIYGFGVTWCNTPIWQQKLGRPTTGEQAATNNQVQLFASGKIISVGQAGIYVLLDTGRWERFPSELGSPTPTLTPTPCSQPPASRWANSLYLVYADQLGCPLGGEVFTQAAFQQYQGGMMVWRDDLDVVYTLYNGGNYGVYDVSGAIDQEYGENLKGSFGWLWSNNGVVRGRLGDPNAPEEVANDFVAQDFENGTLFYFRENFSQNYVLLADLAEWVASN